MKKKIFATAALGLLAANVLGPVALAADDKDKEQSSKTDVTLIQSYLRISKPAGRTNDG